MNIHRLYLLLAAMLVVAVWVKAEEPQDQPVASDQESVEALPPADAPASGDEPPQDMEPPPPPGEEPPPPGKGRRPPRELQQPDPGEPGQPGQPGARRRPQVGANAAGEGARLPRPFLEAAEQLKQTNPQEFNRLMKLRKDDPAAFQKEMRERFQGYVKEKHPEVFKAMEKERKNEEKLQDLARKYRESTDDAKKAELEARMRQLLTDVFDAKQKARQKELEALQNQIKSLQQSLDARATNQAQMIELRMKSLIQGQQAVEW